MISFNTTKEDALLIGKIVARAKKLAIEAGTKRFDTMSLHMDVSACIAQGTPLKLQALLDADDFNFAHDVFGISRHLDRTTGQLTGCFLPRFAA